MWPAQSGHITRALDLKLICHIGTPKTASTFLQNTCAANPEWLEQNGLYYPDLMAPSANHITLFYANAVGIHDFARDYGLKTPEDVKDFRARLSDSVAEQVEAVSQNAHTMIMSSENLIANFKIIKEVGNLRDFLAPHFDDIRIIVYLRRQDDAILSMYGEFMRRGFKPAMTFEEFLKASLGPKTHTPYLYYRRVLSQWVEIFGKDAITVRLFDRKRLRNGDILADFMAEVLQEDAPDLSGLEPSPEDNIGLSAPALEFLRRMQPYIPYRKDGAVNPVRVRLEQKINALPSKPRPKMSQLQSQLIMTHFKGANDWLKDTFFPDEKGALFPVRRNLGEDGNLGKINLKDFARFTGDLLT
jgi:hypothetical protein